jgi:hypothetical protein
MQEPSAFFSLLHAFAGDLETAHSENVKADQAAAKKAAQPVSFKMSSQQPTGYPLPLTARLAQLWPGKSCKVATCDRVSQRLNPMLQCSFAGTGGRCRCFRAAST